MRDEDDTFPELPLSKLTTGFGEIDLPDRAVHIPKKIAFEIKPKASVTEAVCSRCQKRPFEFENFLQGWVFINGVGTCLPCKG